MESFRSTRTCKPQRCIPPGLLMLAILVSSLQQPAATAVDATTTTDSDCPATCGNLTITYPFTLGGRGNSSCGPFQLTCNTSAASGAFLSNSYLKILDIDYGNRSLVVVHVLLAADDGCTVVFNMSSALAIMDRFTISPSNRELYIMSRCSGTQTPVGAVPVTNCSGNSNSSGTFAYLGGGYGTGRPPANDERCELAVLPVLGSEADGATSASYRYRQLIGGGFQLDWDPVGDCNACTESGGRCRYDSGTAAFACLCSDGILRSATCDGKSTHKLTLIVSMSILAGTLVFICLAWLIYRRKQKLRSVFWPAYSADQSNEEEVLKRCGSRAPKRYKYSELKKITKSFKEMLGEGGYGVVFKGSLRDGRMVAVKLLKGSKGNGEEFINEVKSISETSHINIVNLLGYCLEGSKRALVYEYMPNGSLGKHIYSAELVIEWEMLLKISIGIARGLEYLHQGCNTRIIHFDIKPHNILLDNEFCPKISDFGMAKLCHLNGSILSTAEARGTIGFIAPEVFSRAFGAVSTKSDVYSYGMMLLEMVRGKTNMKGYADSSSEAFFPHLLYDHLAGNMQGCEVAHGSEEVARKLTSVGLFCIQMAPDDRPSMSRVIEMLESANEFEMPPRPYLHSPLQSTNASSITTAIVSMSS